MPRTLLCTSTRPGKPCHRTLLYSILFYSILFYSILFYSTLLYSTPLFFDCSHFSLTDHLYHLFLYNSNRCAHCKAFEVIFKMLADSLADDMSVQVVRVDATKNDITHRNVRINAFPTFYFFSVGDQEEPIEYDGERTLEAIFKFIKAFKSSPATKATATAVAAAAGTGQAGTQPSSKLSPFQMDRGSSSSKSERVNESSDYFDFEGEIALTDTDAVAVAVAVA